MIPWDILATLAGGVIAVGIGQYLTRRRIENQQREEFLNTVRAISDLDPETFAKGILYEDSFVNSSLESLDNTFRQNIIWLNDRQKNYVLDLLISAEEIKQDHRQTPYGELSRPAQSVMEDDCAEIINSTDELIELL